jgi:hypothetical protein
MNLQLTTGDENGNGHITLQAGTTNDEYLGGCFYSSFVIRHF